MGGWDREVEEEVESSAAIGAVDTHRPQAVPRGLRRSSFRALIGAGDRGEIANSFAFVI